MEVQNGKKEFWRTVKFTLFSISAGAIELGANALLLLIFPKAEGTFWEKWVFYLIALVLSVVWNFTLNRRYTFKSASNVPVAMLKVALFYAAFTPFSTWFSNFLNTAFGWTGFQTMFATGINMLLNFVLEYLYQRFFVFGKSIDTNDLAKKKE